MRAYISPEEEYEIYMLPEEYNWIDIKKEICNQICQYVLLISEKVKRETLFNAVYNKAEYIEYTIKLAGFDYEDKVKTYHQIANHTYLIKEAQIQQLEQMNIQLCEECVMLCDNQWCLECYAFSILLPNENNENEIEFVVFKLSQGIKPEKAHEIDAEYDLRYSGKDTLVFQPKFLTKINLKIAFEILPKAIIQIASKLLLASKRINIRGGIIDTEYTGDITIMLLNETEKLFKIEHTEKIA
ncbi:hypothetical protein G9A89_010961 [Geosiphon pyriformis]|nr:hypothetical protein G9A89_010961 [Geosiphon pyriformis]